MLIVQYFRKLRPQKAIYGNQVSLVPNCSDSIVNALDLLQLCTKVTIMKYVIKQSSKRSSNEAILMWIKWRSFGWSRKPGSRPISWCHQMKTFSALLAFCAGNSPVTSEFPTQRPVAQSFEVFVWSGPEQTAEQTMETLVIWDVIALIMTSL